MNRFTFKSVLALLLVGWLALSVQGQSTTNAPPLDVRLSAEPERIFVKGIGNTPEETELTLSLNAPLNERMPTDLIIAVDTSATVNLAQMTSIGVSILDQAGADDRIGLVSFATNSKVEVSLTDNRHAVEDGFKQLRNVGRTAIGEGIFTAVNELVEMGRAGANWAVILLTDGRSNTGRPVLAQAQRAADNGVKIFTVGVGRSVDRAVMSEIAKLTHGEFYEKFEDSVPRSIFRSFDQGILARTVRITQILPAELMYERASENAPTRITQNTNRTTTLEWNVDEVKFGQEWKSVFTVSGNKEGTFSLSTRPSKITYNDARGRKVERELPDAKLYVRNVNRAPIAGFDYTPSNPSSDDDISFIDQSNDTDGGIVSWHWDFGDGATSTQASPTHKYGQDGNYTVSLTVTDGDGLTHTRTKTVKVETLKVTVRREIDTYLPNDETLPRQSFKVTMYIEIKHKIIGLGIEENFPDGAWQLVTSDNSNAKYKNESVTRHQWLFQEELKPGDEFTISYTVKLGSARSGKIAGKASSSFPAFEQPISGEGVIKIADKLPFRVLLALWDPNKQAPAGGAGVEGQTPNPDEPAELDIKLGDKLTLAQITAAVSWWSTTDNKPLPEYLKRRMKESELNLALMQQLIAYWLTDTSVHESLPPVR
jgi:PKD repeat protein/Mg-chelatase subunit ChlD